MPSPTALIIGASRGLGLAMAEEYLRRGWHVTGTVRRTARTALHRVADRAKGRLAIEKVDIVKPTQIAALHRRLAEKRFDLLFVNAGIMNDDTIAEVSTAEFVRVMVTNALGPMRVVEAFNDLVKRRGTIGLMSSGLGSIGRSDGHLEVYRASKAALDMMMKGFAARHAARTTVIIAPGWVRTDLGGPDAPLSIAQSIPRVVDVIASRAGARSAVEIYQELGYRDDLDSLAQSLNDLASILASQFKWKEAVEIYASIDDATKDWEPAHRDRIRLNQNRIFTDYYTGKLQDGITLARAYAASRRQSLGDKHVDFAMAQAALGAGLAYAHRDAEALQIYKAAMPILLDYSRSGEDDAAAPFGFDRALQRATQPYLSLLSRAQDPSDHVAEESFRLGEMIGGRSVQRALAASSARSAAGDPALADRLRKKQDLEKEIATQVGMLSNELAVPPETRDNKLVADLRSRIEKLRAENARSKQEIDRRFPKYADLVDPKPPSVEEIRGALHPDEALLSFYFGIQASFVWVVRKDGPVTFAQLKTNARNITDMIKKLRASLESDAATIAEIPPFDLAVAHELYQLLLEPVAAGWMPAKNLVVVTNGALGTLPLSLLPTAAAQFDAGAVPLFAGYRNVPWLARTHAVAMIPSASALVTLRRSTRALAGREKLIGFGDPIFSKEQAQEAARQPTDEPVRVSAATTRGLPLRLRSSPQLDGVDRAELALLPRLPDTAQELKSIALALNADPSKVLNLGITANEQTVKSADLTKYKIVVFATHGLVAGELEGLTQPALALSAPDVAAVSGDGLLTMEEILALKLNADWVVLSACNTGAASGAGAEAASGLGRAFFYAGTRAILVTNWSVHSESARELVTDLFRQQGGGDPALTRAEALRQAMMALLDGKGFTDEKGATAFTYAHPLFWAPYSIIGDGG